MLCNSSKFALQSPFVLGCILLRCNLPIFSIAYFVVRAALNNFLFENHRTSKQMAGYFINFKMKAKFFPSKKGKVFAVCD